MKVGSLPSVCVWAALLFARPVTVCPAAPVTVATYNLERYLDAEGGAQTKTPGAKEKIRENIRALNPDVLAVQEIGGTNVLLELREALKKEGLDFPFWEHVSGFDRQMNLAVLSKLPIVGRRPHAHEAFLLNGRRFFVSRGFVEVDLRANDGFEFTLIAAHLKSRRPVPSADEADLREQEAIRLREIIDARLAVNPFLIVAGDFNDAKDSVSVQTILGRGKTALIDTRPAERNGDRSRANARSALRSVTWTCFYAKEDSYGRFDYLLLSAAMARRWEPQDSYVLAVAGWGEASDHRPVLISFSPEDR